MIEHTNTPQEIHSDPAQTDTTGLEQLIPPALASDTEAASPTRPLVPRIPANPYYPYGSQVPGGQVPQQWHSAGPALAPVPTAQPAYGRPSRLAWLRRSGVQLLLIPLLIVFLAGDIVTRAVTAGTSGNGSTSQGTTGSTVSLGAIPASVQDLQQAVTTVAHAVGPSVVEITSVTGRGEGIGSGDILTKDGYIITNDHVVQGFSRYTVTLSNGTSESAQLVGEDPQDDLAVLKIDASNLQPITFADSSKVQVGQFAIAIGNPLGLDQSATFGIVSALNRTASEAPDGPATELTGLIQTSAPINPGNSGGALVNLQGQLIGIPTLGAINPQTGTAASGIAYALPANRVSYVANQIMKNGHLTSTGQGYLGIQAEEVTPRVATANNLPVQSGILVTGFANDAAGQSPAQQAGIQVGDVIIALDGRTITGNDDFASLLLGQAPGTQVKLTVARSSGQQTITVTLGERPIQS